ncbi:VacB/RNase II family 3'-5' exoribonuclease [Spongiibacter sp. KMU-158]|uniref:exoribonuclease II n=1 Tax=Spongiibacter pelagi TaxID=2760804 RepID=A0A927C0X3_9GAMM|nr:VacB/RNase II family 3'-5' exoribonuclease [Spongiibacter pelagi]MBD2857515.1 VacB/RNase II family 3'-5' exoribonuclease [Spongiibacter pelagi]
MRRAAIHSLAGTPPESQGLPIMLDPNALQQLRQLKTEIIESKDVGIGEVRGSQRRFGFVHLEDGREIFIAPDQMDRVFPGDKVRVNVVTDDNGKFKGELEKLIDSPLSRFTGRYLVRGQGHFVEPDLPRFNKLLFIPPSQRKNIKAGDLLHCQVTRHPWQDGKSQVKVISGLGAQDDTGVEGRYIQRKFELPWQWPKDWNADKDNYAEQRTDLRELPFVTIDSAETRDIDDALWAQATENGWTLKVAVADPGAYIQPGSPLDKAARERANTVYLPGFVQAMLPDQLSQEKCSLLPEADRPAMVCTMQISTDGAIDTIEFEQALIRSHAKLTYTEVNTHLQGEAQLAWDSLEPLKAVWQALRAQRQNNSLIMPEQPDFRYELDDSKRIASIQRVERNDAHRLVEECMLAANRSAAKWLKDQNAPAVYNSHAGLREDRLGSVNKLIAEQLPELGEIKPEQLADYVKLIRATEASESALPLQSIFARMLQPGTLSLEPLPHFGLGLEAYTTFTSPIRRYSDLLVQRAIRAKLMSEAAKLPNAEQIEKLQEHIRHTRQASRQMEQWLQYQYLAKQDAEQVYQGRIAHLNGGGFTVELNDTGINGFVEARGIPEKLSFDADSLRLSNDNKNFQLEQTVNVKVAELDPFAGKLLFTLVEEA